MRTVAFTLFVFVNKACYIAFFGQLCAGNLFVGSFIRSIFDDRLQLYLIYFYSGNFEYVMHTTSRFLLFLYEILFRFHNYSIFGENWSLVAITINFFLQINLNLNS